MHFTRWVAGRVNERVVSKSHASIAGASDVRSQILTSLTFGTCNSISAHSGRTVMKHVGTAAQGEDSPQFRNDTAFPRGAYTAPARLCSGKLSRARKGPRREYSPRGPWCYLDRRRSRLVVSRPPTVRSPIRSGCYADRGSPLYLSVAPCACCYPVKLLAKVLKSLRSTSMSPSKSQAENTSPEQPGGGTVTASP
jgi:hypothetical protein